MSRLGYSLSAFSSQKVPWLPPIIVTACGCTSLAMSTRCIADLYSSVVAVTPTTSEVTLADALAETVVGQVFSLAVD